MALADAEPLAERVRFVRGVLRAERVLEVEGVAVALDGALAHTLARPGDEVIVDGTAELAGERWTIGPRILRAPRWWHADVPGYDARVPAILVYPVAITPAALRPSRARVAATALVLAAIGLVMMLGAGRFALAHAEPQDPHVDDSVALAIAAALPGSRTMALARAYHAYDYRERESPDRLGLWPIPIGLYNACARHIADERKAYAFEDALALAHRCGFAQTAAEIALSLGDYAALADAPPSVSPQLRAMGAVGAGRWSAAADTIDELAADEPAKACLGPLMRLHASDVDPRTRAAVLAAMPKTNFCRHALRVIDGTDVDLDDELYWFVDDHSRAWFGRWISAATAKNGSYPAIAARVELDEYLGDFGDARRTLVAAGSGKDSAAPYFAVQLALAAGDTTLAVPARREPQRGSRRARRLVRATRRAVFAPGPGAAAVRVLFSRPGRCVPAGAGRRRSVAGDSDRDLRVVVHARGDAHSSGLAARARASRRARAGTSALGRPLSRLRPTLPDEPVRPAGHDAHAPRPRAPDRRRRVGRALAGADRSPRRRARRSRSPRRARAPDRASVSGRTIAGMRSIILGAGAIGGVVGGFTWRARGATCSSSRAASTWTRSARTGLRVESPDETFTVRPPVADSAAPVEWRAGDMILLATKSQDVATALRDLAAPPHVPIACFTNGVEAERLALRHFAHVYGVCVMMPGTYLTPGVVQVWAAPVPGQLDIGRFPDGAGEHADDLAGELNVCGFDCQVHASVMKWKRGKLLSNLANGAEALAGPAERNSPIADQARAEGRAVFAAAGLSCTTDAEDKARRGAFRSRPIGGVERAGGSTWQSFARGAGAIETDYLNGEIALLGRLHGVPTPINIALQRVAAEAARAKIAAGSMPVAELAERVRALT